MIGSYQGCGAASIKIGVTPFPPFPLFHDVAIIAIYFALVANNLLPYPTLFHWFSLPLARLLRGDEGVVKKVWTSLSSILNL